MYLLPTGAFVLILSSLTSSLALPDSDLYARDPPFDEDDFALNIRAEPSAWERDLRARDALTYLQHTTAKRDIDRRDPIMADGPGEAIRSLADLISEKTNGCPWNNPGRAECERCKAQHNKKKAKREARGGGGGKGRGGGKVKGGESSTCKQWGF